MNRRGAVAGTRGLPGLCSVLRVAIENGHPSIAGALAELIAHLYGQRRRRYAERSLAAVRSAYPFGHGVYLTARGDGPTEPSKPALSDDVAAVVREVTGRQLARLFETSAPGPIGAAGTCRFCRRRPSRLYNLVAGVEACIECHRHVAGELRRAREEWRARESRRRRLAAGWTIGIESQEGR